MNGGSSELCNASSRSLELSTTKEHAAERVARMPLFNALKCDVFFNCIFVEGDQKTIPFEVMKSFFECFGDGVTLLTNNDMSLALKH